MKNRACVLCVMVLAGGCGSSGGDTPTNDLAVSADSGGAPDLAKGGDDGGGGNFTWPNGEPADKSLYFRATCVSGDCMYPPYDKWFTGTLTRCVYDGIAVEIETSAIPMGADRFSMRFEVSRMPSFSFPSMGTQVDWSLPDGASAFGWLPDDSIIMRSSGKVTFDRCGAEIAGRFELRRICEHHGCNSPSPWLADVVGAFRCKPSMAVDCGL